MSAPSLPEATVFDVCGPLPAGTTVLEASAGTGKTFTIAALATRYVAEGVAELSELMLVTFGRMATSELRDRVRARLVSAERALRRDDARTGPDPLVAHLADVDDAELDRRRSRLRAAVAQFDAATIATTHGFCQQMLASLGVVGDLEPDAVLVPDLADLVEEVVDDLYLRRYGTLESPPLSVSEARDLARAAVGDQHARLEPAGAPPESLAGHRVAFATAVQAEVTRRKRDRRLLDYDDLLVLLRDALADPVHGAVAAERVRSRYRVVLVDEFQDTDPVQWQILRLAFHDHRTLVLIGDPKQAIYAFRGGDVVAYLDAAGSAGAMATLGRSWRSDAPLLEALEHLLGGAALGDPRIVVRPVEAQHRERRLDGGPPVVVRHVTREAFGFKGTQHPAVAAVRELIAADVAGDVVRRLDSTRLSGDDERQRELRPGDVAVLARRNADAAAVQEALVAAGVPAVVSGQSSVFATAAARDWLTLLAALEQPGSSGRAGALALTPFVGWDATRLATAEDVERDELADRVRRWAQLLAGRGVAALFEATLTGGLAERLLRTGTGERRLTDLRHVGQLLHAAADGDRLGTAALTEWLRRRIEEAGQDYAEERSRRLETDAAAVQVVTVHAAKGLEFPLVYVPFAWDRYESQTPPLLRYHDDAGERVLRVGGVEDPGYPSARDRHLEEERGEDLRLLYVALTRARSQVVLWWAASRNSASGPLTRVLFGGHAPGEVPPAAVRSERDEQTTAALAALVARCDGTLVVETVTAAPGPARWQPPATERRPLVVGELRRSLDATWRRTSYTGLTAAAHAEAPGVSSEPEDAGVQDEPAPDAETAGAAAVVATTSPAVTVPSPMSALPGGAAFGTLVHTVLETVDTTAPDLDAELLLRCEQAGTSRVPGVAADDLAAALAPVLATPLGPAASPAGDLTLAGIAPADRLAELEFELPLAGGDSPRAVDATLGAVADLLADHVDPADPFAGYPARLADPALAPARLRGYLTGSIDAVLRVRGEDGAPRYLVADWKTNRLGAPDEALTAWHYRPAAMAAAMLDAHYPLQQLLYTVALHRFLRWRQPGYDPHRHLGAGLYVFVRGMCGPDTPVVGGGICGVSVWRPPADLVVALSRLLEGSDR